jgi:L-ascorbate metabolism protein UlaG (beta-lactamase superfamily)
MDQKKSALLLNHQNNSKREIKRGTIRRMQSEFGSCINAMVLLAGISAASAMLAAPVPVQTFNTSAGAVEITPIFHASVMIKAGDDTIYVDPAPPANISGLNPGGLILITDIHGDHLNMADITALSDEKTTVIAPAAVQATVKSAKTIANGESTQWHKWKITAVPMYNLHNTMPNGTPFHPKGRGNGYVLSYGGKNFYFAGDTEGTPEMRDLKNIDVAFIPMNLPYTMTPEDAADAVKAFKPKVVIPYHYRGQDVQKFASALQGTGIEVRILDWYSNMAPGAQSPQSPPPSAH